jgi:hypothetical protein
MIIAILAVGAIIAALGWHSVHQSQNPATPSAGDLARAAEG